MPYVSPAAIVTGTTISKSTFGDVVKADLDYLANPPACRVYNSAAISIPNVTQTVLTFNSERYDTDSMHSTVSVTDRITFNTAGIYAVSAGIEFGASGTGIRYAVIIFNGTSQLIAYQQSVPQATFGHGVNLSTIYKFAVADYIQLAAYQSSGGALNVSSVAMHTPEFGATWIGLG